MLENIQQISFLVVTLGEVRSAANRGMRLLRSNFWRLSFPMEIFLTILGERVRGDYRVEGNVLNKWIDNGKINILREERNETGDVDMVKKFIDGYF